LPRQPQNTAAEIHLDGSGVAAADLDLGAEGVELAAGIDGIGAHLDEGGIAEVDEVLDGGLEAFREMTGTGGRRARLSIGELLQQAAAQRIRQRGKDQVPACGGGIGRVGRWAAALRHGTRFTMTPPPLPSAVFWRGGPEAAAARHGIHPATSESPGPAPCFHSSPPEAPVPQKPIVSAVPESPRCLKRSPIAAPEAAER